jgi:sensor c-di-GMP phosphodiesterase-like protein
MGRTLNLQLMAEGVETADQAHYLRTHGVRYAQGRLFAQALSADELAAALRDPRT